MKSIIIIIASLLFTACGVSIMFNRFLDDRDLSKQETAITQYCKDNRIYSTNINYRNIVDNANKVNDQFHYDIIEIYTHIAIESEFVSNAVHTNYSTDWKGHRHCSFDLGYMQINSCWNGVICTDMFSNNIMFNPYFNIWAGCYVMRDKLKQTSGDWDLSKYYYNGSGPAAESYRKRFMNVYNELNKLYHKK